MGRVEGETGESVSGAKHARQGSYPESHRPQEEMNCPESAMLKTICAKAAIDREEGGAIGTCSAH